MEVSEMTTLEEFVREVDERIVQIFNEAGVVHAMWHIIPREGKEIFFPSPTVRNKSVLDKVMRACFERIDVVRFAYISEAWTLTGADDDELNDAMLTGLRDHPDRVEILCYTAEDEMGRVLGIRPIIREEGEKPRLGPLTVERTKYDEGRFVGMLPARGRTQ